MCVSVCLSVCLCVSVSVCMYISMYMCIAPAGILYMLYNVYFPHIQLMAEEELEKIVLPVKSTAFRDIQRDIKKRCVTFYE